MPAPSRLLALIVALLALVAVSVAHAAPHLYADPYPATGVQPDAVTFTIGGGSPIDCQLVSVTGGKQPKCDLAGITAAGNHTLVMTACTASSIVNGPNGATVTQGWCRSSVPFVLTLATPAVAAPAGLAVGP